MKERNQYEFKDSTVEAATAAGLKELGLTAEEAEITVKSYGGIFTKACVMVKPLERAEEQAESAEVSAETESEMPKIIADAPVAAAEGSVETDGEIKIHTEAEIQEIEAAAVKCESFVKELLEKMNVHAEVSCEIDADGGIIVSVSGDEAGSIIGHRGEALDAIQYYALMVSNKNDKSFIRVQIDADGYRKKRKETLANLAMRLARKTAKTGIKTELEPMNPFERRVIHTALANDKFVTTTSEGEGRFRHVVIIPNENRPGSDRGNRRGRDDSVHSGGRFDRNRNNGGERRSERVYEDDPEYVPPTVIEDLPVEMSYGTSTGFRKKGMAKTKSFGYKKR